MINELYSMTQTLKDKNILQITEHRDINSPANNPGIYVEIDGNGLPVNIEYIPKDHFVNLWKHSKGNHNSFPIIRIQKPMIRHDLPMEFDKMWKKIKASADKIKILSKLNFNNYNLDSTDILISNWTIEQLLPIIKDNPKLAALHALIDRFPKKEQQKNFYLELLQLIKNQLITFEDPLLELIKDILIGKWDRKKDTFVSSIQIAFDIYDSAQFEYKVKDLRLKNTLIDELNKRDVRENSSMKVEGCYLTGQFHVIEKDKYPEPKLPSLGKTYLYSNNKDIPCLTRYKLKSLQAYNVGKDTIAEINNAISFLTQDDREFKTWAKIPGSRDKEVNLLIAYVEDEPEIEDELARLLGGAPSYEQEVINFQKLSEQICGSLKEKTEYNPNSTVKILILNRVDDGRKQVLLSENYSANDIISGATKWLKAAQNHPSIKYHIWINQRENIVTPFCPYPGQILNFMKKQWKWNTENGKRDLRFEKRPGIAIKDIYDIFIPQINEQELCEKILQKACIQSQDLLLGVGHYFNRGKLNKINKNAIYDHCLIISLISILLYKLNICKEVYMHNVAFNIGRLMMLSDVVHREYCMNVNPQKNGTRSGKIPPQLIGNSVMPTAVEFPNRALDLLRERIRIYKSWADTVSKTDDTAIAKWAVNQMGKVALEISKQEIPVSFSEAERAQVLLGYLARIEKED